MTEEDLLELAAAVENDPDNDEAREELVAAMRSTDWSRMSTFMEKVADMIEMRLKLLN